VSWAIGLLDFSADSEVQSDGRLVRRYMRQYLVRTDSPTFVTEAAVADAVGIKRGSPIGEDTNAICNSVKIGPGPVPTRPPFLAFTATYTFATNAPMPPEVEADSDDPVDMRTQWSVSPQIQTRYVIRDRNDELIVNAAGSPYDGGIPVDVRLGSVTARRRVDAAGYSMAGVLANSGKLNSAPYLGGEPGTVQVDISATEKYEGSYHFWEEVFTFSYDPQGWQPKPANAGFFHIVDGEPQRIFNSDLGELGDDEEDAMVQEPEPLDENGAIVPVASRPSGCTFIEVDYFDTMDFSSFDL
jgi:hypothetical protein